MMIRRERTGGSDRRSTSRLLQTGVIRRQPPAFGGNAEIVEPDDDRGVLMKRPLRASVTAALSEQGAADIGTYCSRATPQPSSVRSLYELENSVSAFSRASCENRRRWRSSRDRPMTDQPGMETPDRRNSQDGHNSRAQFAKGQRIALT